MPLQMHRILHAGYLLECEGTRLLFDPVFETPFSVNCHPWPPVRFDAARIRDLQVDAVFISHYHDDHCSLASLDLLPRDTPIHLYCHDTALHDLIRALGFRSVHALHTDIAVTTGPFITTPVRALEEEVDCLLRIQVEGLNILNVVDAWIDDDTLDVLEAQGPWDLVIWPFQTLRECAVLCPSRSIAHDGSLPPEWLDQLSRLQPAAVIPGACQFIHEPWSWWRHAYFPVSKARFMREIQEILPSACLLDMTPGAGVMLDKQGIESVDALPWVIPDGPQLVDYHYDPDAPVPSTAAIAARMHALNKEARLRLLDWCRETLPLRFAALACGEDWFDTPRHWYLLLWHADGSADVLRYLIVAQALTFVSHQAWPACEPPDANSPITVPSPIAEEADWFTELPATRLAGAVESGETLSSLYIRINDRPMPEETERALEMLDILEDPLLRSLYEDDPFGYQRAQLTRLLSRP